MLGASDVGDAELDRRVTAFEGGMRRLREDPAEAARIDGIIERIRPHGRLRKITALLRTYRSEDARRKRGEALGRDAEDCYRHALEEVAGLEQHVNRLARERDQLAEQLSTLTAAASFMPAGDPKNAPDSVRLLMDDPAAERPVPHAPGIAESLAKGPPEAARELSVRTSVRQSGQAGRLIESHAAQKPARWTRRYLHQMIAVDSICGLAAGLLAFQTRFSNVTSDTGPYLLLSLLLPMLWALAVQLAGGYDSRFIGVGTDEFRRVLNAGVCLTACAAIMSYAAKAELARGYVVIALPTLTMLDLIGRVILRKRLHHLRRQGSRMRKVVIVGQHLDVIADMTAVLRRETYHGLQVVAACAAGASHRGEIGSIPVIGGLNNVINAVERYDADTVAVLSCPEMSGVMLRDLAWKLEKTGTDLCVAPTLLDIAGPRTTIRPVAGLPLLHMGHPEFTGTRRAAKAAFDRAAAATALVCLAPLFLFLIAVIRVFDGGPALFRETRIGRGGRTFMVFKFRTTEAHAEKRSSYLKVVTDSHDVLFMLRNEPRVTVPGAWMRRWSLDKLPQLLNVLIGDMSLVGPRPALPQEAARYGENFPRRLAVKPGLTGLWQVSERSRLPWDESVRLDMRYVENWSFALDLQILSRTASAIMRVPSVPHPGHYVA
jgi:exopolysaccharide biosynthesis polyprenyl glycosylphosphotransferase